VIDFKNAPWKPEIDVSKVLLKNELSSIFFQSGFQSAIQTLIKFMLKNEETCSKKKMGAYCL